MTYETLENFLKITANKLAPIDPKWPDHREYKEHINPDALDDRKWIETRTSYIWKVGVLAQWDSNKCDYARIFIGHEREPKQFDFIGVLHWQGGENDDIGRVLPRYLKCMDNMLFPVFNTEDKF